MKKETSSLNEKELIEMYKNGDDYSFTVLYNRNYKALRAFVISLLSSNRDEKADEICQETFLKAFLFIKNEKYEDNGKFLSFLFTIGKNIIFNRYLSEKRKPIFYSFSDLEIEGKEKQFEDIYYSPDKIMENKEISKNLNFCLNDLSEKYRMIIVLNVINDLSFKKISLITNINYTSLRTRKFYAIKELRSKLLQKI